MAAAPERASGASASAARAGLGPLSRSKCASARPRCTPVPVNMAAGASSTKSRPPSTRRARESSYPMS
eukprot:scaffold241583_cov30-Tisochrysis_lutea.AAC.3